MGYVGGALWGSKGTALRPLLYILYTAPLFNIIAQHRDNTHQYTDDLQLYLCVPPAEATIATDRCCTS